jgi:hypothetical protein
MYTKLKKTESYIRQNGLQDILSVNIKRTFIMKQDLLMEKTVIFTSDCHYTLIFSGDKEN